MFFLVPAYPGCPRSKAVKRSLLLLLLYLKDIFKTEATVKILSADSRLYQDGRSESSTEGDEKA